MADNAGMDAIRAMTAKKRNAGGVVANALKNSPPKQGGSNSGSPNNAIARRLAKGSSKSSPTKPSDNDGDEQESGY